MAHNQFIRKAELVIGDNSTGIDFSQLQFSFSIKQADMNSPQTANIRIYNVSPDTAKQLKIKEYTRVILNAGYQQGNYGLIFDGEIIQARIGRDSPVDTYLDILAAEGYYSNQSTVNQTLIAGSTDLDAANVAAVAMGKSLKSYDYDPSVKLPRGQVLYGMSRDVLHQQAATAGYSYFYNKGQIHWVPLQTYKPGDAVLLNADTGMIGWPEQTEDGIKVRCLLNPLLDVGSRFKIDNASIQRAQLSSSYTFVNTLPNVDNDGTYRIYVIEHHGDTRGNDWYSDIIGLAVNNDTGFSTLLDKGQF